MNWFKGVHPSKAEMREELEQYLAIAHPNDKHLPQTHALLKLLWSQSRQRPPVDAWRSLDPAPPGAPAAVVSGSQVKTAFRKRLLARQLGRCCYCRRWLVNSAWARPIDHILPRDQYPQFSIEFWNLAVACTDCNSAKTNTVWGSIPKSRRRYPRPSEFSESFHPRFHRYDEHVRFIRLESNRSAVLLYIGMTNQGRHLCRSLLHKIAAKETLVENNPELAPAMAHIRNFQSQAHELGLGAFDAFCTSLDQSVLRVLGQHA